MKHSLRALGAVLAISTSLLLATMAQGQRADTTPTDATACAALSHKIIPGSAIGLPTTGAKVEAATFETTNAGKPFIGGFCKILGAISPLDPSAPPIHFEINLPSTWNGKAVQLGGGFFDGTPVTGLGFTVGAKPGSPSPIVQGYVTLGSDSGHQGKAVDDASFARNPESLRNFAGDQIKKTHDVAMALMQARYAKTPDHFYFVGGSQGGHAALIAAQRFEQGCSWPRSFAASTTFHRTGRVLFADGGEPTVIFNPLQLIGRQPDRTRLSPFLHPSSSRSQFVARLHPDRTAV